MNHLPNLTIWTHLVLCKDRPFPINCVCVHLAFLRVRMSISVCSCAVGKSSVERWFVPGVTMVNQRCKHYRTFSWKHHYFGQPTFHHCVHASRGSNMRYPIAETSFFATRLADEAFLLRVQRIKISALEDFSVPWPVPWPRRFALKTPKTPAKTPHEKMWNPKNTNKNTTRWPVGKYGKIICGTFLCGSILNLGGVW